jgi:multidrug efflux pump
MRKSFPPGVEYAINYDPTQFIRESMRAVMHTLLEALLLVVIVVVVFLQTWRASIIPLLAVPVSLIGTLAVMKAFGFSLNSLSLFGIVLAIGIVVDDAIVVENVERFISNGALPLKKNTQAFLEKVRGLIDANQSAMPAHFVREDFAISTESTMRPFNPQTFIGQLRRLALAGSFRCVDGRTCQPAYFLSRSQHLA